MKKGVLITLIAIFLGFTIASAFLFYINNDFYELSVPELDQIESITLNDKNFNNKETIETILNILTNDSKGRKARAKSESELPKDIEGLIQINFNLNNGKKNTLYIYQQEHRYLIEQPYQGIHVITQKDYNTLKELSE